MYPAIFPTLSAARNSLPRTMSSLASGYILQGACWNYRILKPVKGDSTHISNVFKAEVVPHGNASNASKAPQWFVCINRIQTLMTNSATQGFYQSSFASRCNCHREYEP